MDWATALLYLKNHKSEDSDTILLVFNDNKSLRYWKQINGIAPSVDRFENYEWAVLSNWVTVVGRRYKEYRRM